MLLTKRSRYGLANSYYNIAESLFTSGFPPESSARLVGAHQKRDARGSRARRGKWTKPLECLQRGNPDAEPDSIHHQIPRAGHVCGLPRLRHELRRLTSFTEDISTRGMRPGSRTIFFGQVSVSAEVAEHLAVHPGAHPAYPAAAAPGRWQARSAARQFLKGVRVHCEELEQRGSLCILLEARGVRLVDADETIETVSATRREARWLHVSSGAPLLLVSRHGLPRNRRTGRVCPRTLPCRFLPLLRQAA